MASQARIFPTLRGILAMVAALCVFAISTPDVAAQGWQITKIEGRNYVSIENVKKFYGFQTAEKKGNSVILKSVGKTGKHGIIMQLQIGSQECFLNKVKFIFTHSVEPGGSLGMISQMDLIKLIEPVLRPNFIPNAGNFRTVILDPGHGGKDPGATNPLGTEANYNLTLATKIKGLLEQNGFKVILTRTTDRYYSLQERVEIANAVKDNSIFISLHFNSGGRDARGIETFTLSPPGVAHYGSGFKASDSVARQGNVHDSANIALATAVHGSILKLLNETTFDRGIKRARFSVLSGIRHPAILFEGGFMSHPYEARLIANDKYLNTLARGINIAIQKYRIALTRSTVAKPNP
jgi:N-acetylmuramoyl-L-alanine amidase